MIAFQGHQIVAPELRVKHLTAAGLLVLHHTNYPKPTTESTTNDELLDRMISMSCLSRLRQALR